MPAAKKPPEKLQRRNKPKETDAQIIALNAKAPTAPKGLCNELKAEWKVLWKQPMAAHYTDADMPMIKRLFRLKQQEIAHDEDGTAAPLTFGSTGQPQLNPHLKHAQALRSEILQLEDRLGLNPLAKMKLGIATGDAHKSLDDMNARFAHRATGGEVSERPDPRLANNVIDVNSR
jgi:P27 family predicted phage terminase small subunit